jgi:hypothetical protein
VSDSARLALIRLREQGVEALCWFLSEPQACTSVCWPLGVFVTRQQVFDPLAWYGAAMTALCGGQGDPSFVGCSVVKAASR